MRFITRLFRKSVLLACMVVGVRGMTADSAPMAVTNCATPPVIDGVLSDSAWQKPPLVDELFLKNSNQSSSATRVWMTFDRQYLYLGFHCANSNMSRVIQRTFDHDSPAYKDDSVQLFVRPSAARERYDLFVLSFANVVYDEQCTTGGWRNRGWTPPLRSMTAQQADGWTAELAIPLFIFDCDDFGDMEIGLVRNYNDITLDVYGALQEEKIVAYALSPDTKNFHDVSRFRPVKGAGGFKPDVPFAPQVVAAEIAGYHQQDDRICYVINALLKSGSPMCGMAELQVVEDDGRAETVRHREQVKLAPAESRLPIIIPVTEFRDRKVKLLLVAPDNPANVLAFNEITDVSALSVIRRAFAGRSFYSSEDAADIILELGLPDAMLAKAILKVELAGQPALECKGVRTVMTPKLPLKMLAPGDNQVDLRILVDGRELAARRVNVLRLTPRPGYETKADFIRGVVLKDQKPFFPVGICCHVLYGNEDDAWRFDFLKRIGLNTLVKMRIATNTVSFMNLAEARGFNVITWNYPNVDHYMSALPKLFNLDFQDLAVPARIKEAMTNDPQFWSGIHGTMALPERLLLRRALYEQVEPGVVKEVEVLRDYKNFVGYWNVDEPNLINSDDRIALAEWYWKTTRRHDPHHPQFLLYSMNIPFGDNWTRWGDILGFDIYPRPYTGGLLSEPGLYTAYYACQLRERCRRDNKIMWFVPLANMLDLGRTPIGMSKAQMLCQAYTAIIYGARGLLYFALNAVVGEEAWDALSVISARVSELAPALLNGDVPQTVKYTPDNFYPREQKFPMINAAVFQYPAGDYLLLAANIMPFAVDTKFNLRGMRQAARLFEDEDPKAQSEIELMDESFAEKIEPCGTRAYRIKLRQLPAAAGDDRGSGEPPRPADAATAGAGPRSGLGHPLPVEVAAGVS